MTFAGGALFVPTVPRSSAPFDLRSGSGSWHEATGFIALDLSLYLSQALGKVKLIRDGGTQAPRINSTVTDGGTTLPEVVATPALNGGPLLLETLPGGIAVNGISMFPVLAAAGMHGQSRRQPTVAASKVFILETDCVVVMSNSGGAMHAIIPLKAKGDFMPDLTNSNPTPPAESQAKLDKAEEESKKLESPTRTNDSTIDPEKPAEDVLKGFHGG